MSFYQKWYENLTNDKRCKYYINEFLNGNKEAVNELENGDKCTLEICCKTLLSIPIEEFIDCINTKKEYGVTDIVQFSDFESAIIKTPAILEIDKSELSFCDLGKALINAKTVGACTKYGENHAKLAKELSLVAVSKRPIYVKNTNFGAFTVYLDSSSRLEIIKRIALRNKFIYSLIFDAKQGKANYMKMALTCLKKSTAERRRSNVKYIVKLILQNNSLLHEIEWR